VICYATLSFFAYTIAFGGCTAEHAANAAGTKGSANTASSHFTTIVLDKSVHFTAPDGTDMLVTAGTYRVERASRMNLLLVQDATQAAIEIPATSFTHEEAVAAPLAFAVREEEREDAVHLLLLLPGGLGLDAAGETSDVQSRSGDARLIPRSRDTGVAVLMGTDRQTQQYSKMELLKAEASDATARMSRCDPCKMLKELRK
jgi:hypothetical protein